MSSLPYEIIDIILKMASTTNDLYYLQIDYKTGKLIYKHNMQCPRLSNLKINPLKVFQQNLLYNDVVYNIFSVAINKEVIYKKNIDNTIFIYYRKTTDNKFNGELITNKISYVMTDYNIWTSIQHTDGWCYDCVGVPEFISTS
jgi:hypothetical protein